MTVSNGVLQGNEHGRKHKSCKRRWNWRNQSIKTLTMPPHALSQSSSLTTEASQGGVIALTTIKIIQQHDIVSFCQAMACRQIY